MFRFLVYVIFFIINIVLNTTYRRNIYGENYDTGDSYLFNFFSKRLRRLRALKTCKNFLKEYQSSYKLENDFVVVIMNTQTEILRAYNKKNRKETITINWTIERTLTYNYELFDERFNYICETFNSHTNYTDICNELFPYFNSARKTQDEPQKKQETKENGVMPLVEQHRLLDINTATEKEITDLPGINIILAKKIIKYREINMGFGTLSEFYNVMNIKPHFVKKLDKLICVNEYKIPEKKKNSDDRIIDF